MLLPNCLVELVGTRINENGTLLSRILFVPQSMRKINERVLSMHREDELTSRRFRGGYTRKKSKCIRSHLAYGPGNLRSVIGMFKQSTAKSCMLEHSEGY